MRCCQWQPAGATVGRPREGGAGVVTAGASDGPGDAGKSLAVNDSAVFLRRAETFHSHRLFCCRKSTEREGAVTQRWS